MMVFPKAVVCWRGERTTVIPGRRGVPAVVTCCVVVVLGRMLTLPVRGWNEVKDWAVPAVLDGMMPTTFCCTWTTPWPCLTHEANVCWKFLFCWNVTGVPNLVASTTFVPGVTGLVREPTTTFCVVDPVLVGVLVVLTVLPPGFC